MARTVCLGRSGVGKSWYAGHYIESVLPKFEYGIHYDIEDEEKGLCEDYDHDPDSPYLGKLPVDSEIMQKSDMENILRKYKKLRVVPEGLTSDELEELFARLCDAAMEVEDCHVSADEAHRYIKNSSIDERVNRMATGGRKYGVEWFITTQRPQNLHEDILSQANYGVYFQITKDRDIKKVNKSSGINAERLRKLGERKAIIENFDSGNIQQVDTNDLERKTVHYASDDGKADSALKG